MKNTDNKILYWVLLIGLLFAILAGLDRLLGVFWKSTTISSDAHIGSSIILGHQFRPSSKFELDGVTYQTNQLGFRDREFSLKKQKGKRRIAFLGDSYIEGLGLEQGETIPKKLEFMIPRSEVFNCGIRGGSPGLYYYWLKALEPYQLDVVILSVFSNDMDDDASLQIRNSTARLKAWYALPDALKKSNIVSRLWVYFHYVTSKSDREKLSQELFGTPDFHRENSRPDGKINAVGQNSFGYMIEPEIWKSHWNRTQDYLSQIASYLEQKEIELVVIYIPHHLVFSEKNEDHFSIWMEEWAKKHNIHFLNFNPSISVYDPMRNFHFNEVGSEFIAKKVAQYLKKNELNRPRNRFY